MDDRLTAVWSTRRGFGLGRDRLVIAHDGAARGVDRRPVAGDRVDGVEPDDPVDRGRDVALELAEAAIGPRPEDPVLLARVEPEGVQHPLELADVVPAERRRAQVQGAVAEPVAGLDWARRALKLGSRDPSFLYHAGISARGAGRSTLARTYLARSLLDNPRFSPLYGPRAERALAELR